MPRFIFRLADGRERTVRSYDEASARQLIAQQTTHPEPEGNDGPWTPERIAAAQQRMADAAAALTLVSNP